MNPKKRPNTGTPSYYVDRITNELRKKQNALNAVKLWSMNMREDATHGWKMDRNYEQHYNPFFSMSLKKFFKARNTVTIVDAFKRLAKLRGTKKLNILEDGAGEGAFLAKLKQMLLSEGIANQTTALCLHPPKELLERQKEGQIDDVVKGPAETFAPNKKYDAIISMFGSIDATLDVFRKSHVRKFAYSLNRGGIMMVGFTFSGIQPLASPGHPIHGLSENPKQNREMSIFMEMGGIERAFKKMGFRAKFYRTKKWPNPRLPNFTLIVQRNP